MTLGKLETQTHTYMPVHTQEPWKWCCMQEQCRLCAIISSNMDSLKPSQQIPQTSMVFWDWWIKHTTTRILICFYKWWMLSYRFLKINVIFGFLFVFFKMWKCGHERWQLWIWWRPCCWHIYLPSCGCQRHFLRQAEFEFGGSCL